MPPPPAAPCTPTTPRPLTTKPRLCCTSGAPKAPLDIISAVAGAVWVSPAPPQIPAGQRCAVSASPRIPASVLRALSQDEADPPVDRPRRLAVPEVDRLALAVAMRRQPAGR